MTAILRCVAFAGILSISAGIAGCGTSSSPADSSAQASANNASSSAGVELVGSGATFPNAFYEAAIAAFSGSHAGVKVTYSGGGSGKGRQDLAAKRVDFAGTDSIIKTEDLSSFAGGAVLYFPTVVAPITVSYRLQGVDGLQLSGSTIAKIFQREITSWDDPAIAAENSALTLPATPIVVVHRSDSSGTTKNFTKFLDASAGVGNGAIWTLGADNTVEWPADTQAGDGNAGVAQAIAHTEGAIGYVDLADAKGASLKTASVLNKAGLYVAPTLAGASAAIAGTSIHDDLTFSGIWADGAASYPITAQTWIIVYQRQTDTAHAQALSAFLRYVLTDGQALAPTVDFAALPTELAAKAVARLSMIGTG